MYIIKSMVLRIIYKDFSPWFIYNIVIFGRPFQAVVLFILVFTTMCIFSSGESDALIL